MPSEVDPQEFGEVKATVAQFGKSMDDLKDEMAKLTATVAALNKRLDKARNWWQLLLIQGSIISAAAVAGAWLWDHIPHK